MSFAFRQFQFRIASGIKLSSYFNSLHLVCDLIREPVGSDDSACGAIVDLDGRDACGALLGR
jgi:hypothetical protein